MTCGLKIDKPYVYENYCSIPAEKFISFSKKVYPFYIEVIDLIKPELDKRGIQVVQLRATPDNVDVDPHILNALTFGQWAYVIKHSMLHFGEDDFIFDLAGFYDIPRVILFSHTYPNTTKPYWGSPEKERIIFNPGEKTKPTFSLEPSQNQIKLVKPEEVAVKIMELLGIPWTPPYETVYFGNLYRPQHDIIEVCPAKGNISIEGKASTVAVRMDYGFDEKFLAQTLQQVRLTVVTDKPVQLGLLQTFKANIQEVLYLVDESSDVQFARDLGKLNLPYGILSVSTHEQFQKLTPKFFDVCPLTHVPLPDINKIPELKSGIKGLFYKSGKRIKEGEKEYKCRFDMLKGITSRASDFSPCPDEADPEFMKDLDLFYIARKK